MALMYHSRGTGQDRLVFRPAGHGMPLVIEDATAFAVAVFESTASSVGSFDARVALGPSDRVSDHG